MSAVERNIQLARSLPVQLQRFFALNPPRQFRSTSSSSANETEETESRRLPNAQEKLNPFLPHKHPATGRWHPPIYSLRRQADLVKMARAHGVEDLLPYTKKSTAERRRIRDERGLRIQGTGEGQKVKGHIWERTMNSRLEKRRQAMREMPRMIQEWKQVCLPQHFLLLNFV